LSSFALQNNSERTALSVISMHCTYCTAESAVWGHVTLNLSSSPAVVKRPLDASCLSVASIVDTIRRAHVPLQIYCCAQLNYVLFSSLWSTMLVVINTHSLVRGGLCGKLHGGPSHSTSHQSIASLLFVENSRYLPTFDAPLVGSPSEYCHAFGTEKLQWYGYPKVVMFIRYDRIHERDRQTDGQTPHDDKNYLSDYFSR